MHLPLLPIFCLLSQVQVVAPFLIVRMFPRERLLPPIEILPVVVLVQLEEGVVLVGKMLIQRQRCSLSMCPMVT